MQKLRGLSEGSSRPITPSKSAAHYRCIHDRPRQSRAASSVTDIAPNAFETGQASFALAANS